MSEFTDTRPDWANNHICMKHNEQMVLTFYQRGPGDAPGNAWVCQSCKKEILGAEPPASESEQGEHSVESLEKEYFKRGREWEIAEFRRHLVNHASGLVLGQCWWCRESEAWLAGQAAASQPAPENKGLCEVCHHEVWILPLHAGNYADHAWHSKEGKVWHEVCSYQQQIKELQAALAHPERKEADEIVEECATIADNYGREGDRLSKEFACEMADELASRIRALKGTALAGKEADELRERVHKLADRYKRQARADCDPANGVSSLHARGRLEAEFSAALDAALGGNK
jgi:hypothetical protein